MAYGLQLKDADGNVTLTSDGRVLTPITGNIISRGTYMYLEHQACAAKTSSTRWVATQPYRRGATGNMSSLKIPLTAQGERDGISVYKANDNIVFSPITGVGIGRDANNNKSAIILSTEDERNTQVMMVGWLTNPVKGYFDVYNASKQLMWSANSMPRAVQHIKSVRVDNLVPTTITLDIPVAARGNIYLVNTWGYIVASIDSSGYGSAGEWLTNYYMFSENQTKFTYWSGQYTWNSGSVYPYARQRVNPWIPNIVHLFYIKP